MHLAHHRIDAIAPPSLDTPALSVKRNPQVPQVPRVSSHVIPSGGRPRLSYVTSLTTNSRLATTSFIHAWGYYVGAVPDALPSPPTFGSPRRHSYMPGVTTSVQSPMHFPHHQRSACHDVIHTCLGLRRRCSPRGLGLGHEFDDCLAEGWQIARTAAGNKVSVHHHLGVFKNRPGVNQIILDPR